MSGCCSPSNFPSADLSASMSRNYKLIWTEINLLQMAILNASNKCVDTEGGCEPMGGDRCVTVAGDTPMTFVEGITSATITDTGSGYVNPYIEIIDEEGSGAILIPEVYASYLSNVIIQSTGANYTSSATAVVHPGNGDPAPTGVATISLNVNVNIFPSNPELYYYYVIGQSDNRTVQDQVESVLNHFKILGYSIEAQVNPSTNLTIQWKICW